jgi:hypothetical protein
MVDGHKLVVADSVAEVVDKVRRWRAEVAAEAFALSDAGQSAAHYDQAAAAGRTDGGQRHQPVPPAADHEVEAVAQAGGSSLARVLHLPAREE